MKILQRIIAYVTELHSNQPSIDINPIRRNNFIKKKKLLLECWGLVNKSPADKVQVIL